MSYCQSLQGRNNINMTCNIPLLLYLFQPFSLCLCLCLYHVNLFQSFSPCIFMWISFHLSRSVSVYLCKTLCQSLTKKIRKKNFHSSLSLFLSLIRFCILCQCLQGRNVIDVTCNFYVKRKDFLLDRVTDPDSDITGSWSDPRWKNGSGFDSQDKTWSES